LELGTAAQSAATDFLGATAKAADSDKLDNHDTAYFQTALVATDSISIGTISATSYVGIGTTAFGGATPSLATVVGIGSTAPAVNIGTVRATSFIGIGTTMVSGLGSIATLNEVALGTNTSGNYVAGATTDKGLTLSGTEGGTLGVKNCGTGEILKYTAGAVWDCAADATGASSGTPGGLTTQIQFNNAGALNGVDGFIYNGTNIGIGSSAPSRKLDIVGTVKATAFVGDGSGLTGLGSSSKWAADGVGINTTVNVGLGTINPVQKLEVAGTVKATQLVTSLITDNGVNVGVGTSVPAGTLSLFKTAGSSVNLIMGDGDVGHGVTTLAPTTAWFALAESNATKGGAFLTGLTDGSDTHAIELRGVSVNNPDDGVPTVSIDGYSANGTGTQALAAGKTLFQLQNNHSAVISVLGSGNTTFSGTIAGSNLSGTNTGDGSANSTYSGLDFLIGTATTALSGEIVAGTAPGGELGGTWASPTIDDGVTVANWVLTTPNVGIATATSINKLTITAPATSATLTIADGKTLTATNTVNINTLTDGKWCKYTASGTVLNCDQDAPAGSNYWTQYAVGIGTTGQNVGIGTSVPKAKLEVLGGLYQSSGTVVMGLTSGNIGLGSSVPTAKLDVSGTARVTNVQIYSPLTDQTSSGIVIAGIAGASLTIDNAIYASSSGQWFQAKADAATTVPVQGIALNSASAAAVVNVLTVGYYRDDSWNWTPGGLIYISPSTAGGLTQTRPSTTGQQVQIVGFAVSADVIYFNPDYTYVEI
jgi:hypothetical protein